MNSLGEEYESKIPDFYKPVTTEMIWDGNKHSVQLEWGNLSVADGDEADAVKIEAWYDGEKVMTVIDEMPFTGEIFGEPVDVDKRDMNGYVAWYTFHDNTSPSLDAYGYLLRISSMTIVPGPDNSPNGGSGDNPGTAPAARRIPLRRPKRRRGAETAVRRAAEVLSARLLSSGP